MTCYYMALYDCSIVGLIRMTFPGSKGVAVVHELWCKHSCVLTATNFVYAINDSLRSLTRHVQFACPQPS